MKSYEILVNKKIKVYNKPRHYNMYETHPLHFRRNISLEESFNIYFDKVCFYPFSYVPRSIFAPEFCICGVSRAFKHLLLCRIVTTSSIETSFDRHWRSGDAYRSPFVCVCACLAYCLSVSVPWYASAHVWAREQCDIVLYFYVIFFCVRFVYLSMY